MALQVEEIMNREVFSAAPDDDADQVLARLLRMGLSSAPVLDGARRPVGMVSLRDLAGARPGARVAEHMSTPAVGLGPAASIEEAARLLAETGYHHLVVIDEEGVVAGVLSTLDVLRGLTGLPARHPSVFPHYDHRTGMRWTDDTVLEPERVEAAPSGPGVLALVHGDRYLPEIIIRVESTEDVRGRLREMLDRPSAFGLSYWLARGNLRFRAATVHDQERRQRTVDTLLGRGDGGPPRD